MDRDAQSSVEDILEQIYRRLEKEYAYSDKDVHLNTLQEVMVMLTKHAPLWYRHREAAYRKENHG